MTEQLLKHESGARRGTDANATRYDLISPIALEAVAETCAEGALKHGDMNWELGFPVHDLLNHAVRHVYKFLGGDRSEPHLPHAAWNLMAAIHSLALWPHLNEGRLRSPGCTLGNDVREFIEIQQAKLDAAKAGEIVPANKITLVEDLRRAFRAAGIRDGNIVQTIYPGYDAPQSERAAQDYLRSIGLSPAPIVAAPSSPPPAAKPELRLVGIKSVDREKVTDEIDRARVTTEEGEETVEYVPATPAEIDAIEQMMDDDEDDAAFEIAIAGKSEEEGYCDVCPGYAECGPGLCVIDRSDVPSS